MHASRVRIETPRLTLRDFEPDDWSAAQRYSGDPEAVRYRPFGPCTEDETREHIAGLARQYLDPDRRMFDLAVVLKESGEVVGSVDIGRMRDDRTRGGLGYILVRAFWRMGLGTEAARAAVEFAFTTLGVDSVCADVDVENIASVRVLEKIGMQCVSSTVENIKGRERALDIYEVARGQWVTDRRR